MKIVDKFGQGRALLSMEIFPPKPEQGIDTLYDMLDELVQLNPDYISVTFGAGGSLNNTSTRDIAITIKNKYGFEAMPHLTCVNCGADELFPLLDDYKERGIENILALRGDKNPKFSAKEDFRYASELTDKIREHGGFCISGACYPECHFEAPDMDTDIRNLKHKIDCGAEALVSQLFFDNSCFYSFIDRARAAGITVPIEAGIMPVTSKKSIERMVSQCGASLPPKFVKMIQRYDGKPEALIDAGIAYAVDQITDLLASGVDGVHIYIMNKPYIARRITESVSKLL